METFGEIIGAERRRREQSLKAIAKQILKPDGKAISVQYLDNLERDLRTPSLELVPQFAQVLELPVDLLYAALGIFPPDLLEQVATREHLLAALQTLRESLARAGETAGKTKTHVHYMRSSSPSQPLTSYVALNNVRTRRLEKATAPPGPDK